MVIERCFRSLKRIQIKMMPVSLDRAAYRVTCKNLSTGVYYRAGSRIEMWQALVSDQTDHSSKIQATEFTTPDRVFTN